jgi:hypothetical protein
VILRDCFGRERSTPDPVEGIFRCPFCDSASRVGDAGGQCANPWCVAHPNAPPAAHIASAHAEALAEQERLKREAWHRQSMKRSKHRNLAAARAASLARARARRLGACTDARCLWPSYQEPLYRPTRFVRHRGTCPHQR